MKILKFLGIILGLGLFVILMTGAYYGLFAKVEITEETTAPMTIYVARHTGAYSGVSPVVKKLYEDLKDSAGMVPTVGVGVYYDNTQDTPIDSLRSFIGVKVTPEDQFILASHDLPYETITLPPMRAYVARFPYKGMPSLLIAISKVYPRLHAYCNEKEFKINSPTFEIYDEAGSEIRMVVPISLSKEEYSEWWTPSPEKEVTGPNLLDSLEAQPQTDSVETK